MNNASKYAGKDFYKILKIEHTATAQEIKLAYYKQALHLHPDKNDGCSRKEAEFKRVNEAYDVLRDDGKRREYDFTIGHRYNKNRRTAPPRDYRKVYAPRPPPDWKFTWDHAKHYEMHYGDGFQKMALHQMKQSLKQEGRLDYQSPLGKGFHFSSEPLETHNKNNNNSSEQHLYNPYSKHSPQGPPEVTLEYSEGSLHTDGRQQVERRERIIVQDLHTRRQERQRQQQQRSATPPRREAFARYSTHATAARNHRHNDDDDGGVCVIM